MTFTEIRAEIADRLNLTSSTALARLDRAINRVYRAVTSSIGIETSRRAHLTANTTMGVAEVTFTSAEKVLSVWVPDGSSNRILKEVTHAQLLELGTVAGDTPSAYAVTQMAATSVTITLDQTPQTVFTVHAEAQSTAATLSGSDQPAFPASFHDILIEGVLADEYLKLEKPTLGVAAKQTYERRLGELRLRIATSRTRELQQGSAARGVTGISGGGSGSLPNGGFSYTQTGLITFDRDPAAPFAVTPSSAVVSHLDADKLDGQEGSYYTTAANLTGPLPAISGANLTNLDASDLASGTIPDARFPATIPASGISFPAVQVPSGGANVLDDYEEGTWTPVIGGGGGTSGQTYTAQQGRYIKVGSMVWASCRVILSNKGTITGSVEIQGLPFTAENGVQNAYQGALIWDALATTWVFIAPLVQQNSTVAQVHGATAAAISSLTNLVTADISNTTAFRCLFVYRAAS